jgi:UDP-glucose 4-epimerase
MRILITGVRGFIGAAVASAAHAQGHDVVGVDQSVEGRPVPSGVRTIQGDITRPAAWREAFAEVDVVIHSAAMHHTDQIAEGPVRSIEVNLHGTRLVLDAAASAGVRRFINLSSAKVYGEPLSVPSCEDDLLNPVEPYGLAKAVSEEHCRYYAARSTMRCISVRPFSVYGPRQDLSTGYVGQLIQGWLSHRPVPLAGRPDFLRDFVHIDDVVDVCLAAATYKYSFDVVNVGTGKGTSLADLVSEFAQLCGDGINVNYTPARAGTIQRARADADRMLSLLSRDPVTLRAGLVETSQWFREANRGVA